VYNTHLAIVLYCPHGCHKKSIKISEVSQTLFQDPQHEVLTVSWALAQEWVEVVTSLDIRYMYIFQAGFTKHAKN
jgi:hypothetical protein